MTRLLAIALACLCLTAHAQLYVSVGPSNIVVTATSIAPIIELSISNRCSQPYPITFVIVDKLTNTLTLTGWVNDGTNGLIVGGNKIGFNQGMITETLPAEYGTNQHNIVIGYGAQ